MLPLRVPDAWGEKVTLIVQDPPPGATEPPQLFVDEKSPLETMLEMSSLECPGLLSFTVCGTLVVSTFWPGKVKLVGDKFATATIPFPVRPTDCGLLEALSVIVIAPVRVPTAVGVEVTEIMQFPPDPTELPQVFV